MTAPEIKGFSAGWGWLFDLDFSRFAQALKASGYNSTSLDMFTCPSYRGGTDGGYWHWLFAQPWYQWRLVSFLDAMHAEGIYVRVIITGANYDGVTGLTDAWFDLVWRWLLLYAQRRPAYGADVDKHRLMGIEPICEFGHSKGRSVEPMMLRWIERVQAEWGAYGWDCWYSGGNAPGAGWIFENHPQHTGDMGPDNSVTMNDAPIDIDLSRNGVINQAVAIPYWRGIRQAGRGLIVLAPETTGDIDYPGLAAVGAALR